MVHAWIVIVKKDFPPGPPQVHNGSFWSRVCHLFHHEMRRAQYHRIRDVKFKFLDLKQRVNHFKRIYNKIDNENPNMDDDIIIRVAMELYRFESNSREITHGDAWNLL